jgi:LysM repeat protein
MFGKLLVILVVAAVVWGAVTRSSSGAGRERVYTVRPADTLWSIASAHYGGDPRESVWKLERRNHLENATVRVGEKLVLP